MVFSVDKKKASRFRKIPFLPRIGIYIDIAGYEIIYRRIPFLETLMNLPEKGITYQNFKKITKAQMAEIQFPQNIKRKVINTSARTISSVIKSK